MAQLKHMRFWSQIYRKMVHAAIKFSSMAQLGVGDGLYLARNFHSKISAPAVKADPVKVSHLSRLPPEILLLISKYLDAADRACLALCNVALSHGIGALDLDLRVKDHPCRWDLLSRLSRDHPQYILCREHATLHKWDQPIGPPCIGEENIPHCAASPTKGPWESLMMFTTSSLYNMTFQHFRLAMERHFYGAERGISLDNLSWAEIRTSDVKGLTLSSTMEPQIVSGQLYMRIQQWVMIRPDAINNTLEWPHDACCYTPTPCIHEWTVPNRDTRRYYCGIHCIAPLPQSPTFYPYRKCPVCDVESQIEIKGCGNSGTAIIVTKWINLGTGRTPLDWEWRRHSQYVHAIVTGSDEATQTPIREAFEQQCHKATESLSAETESLICNGRYQDTFERHHTLNILFGETANVKVWIRRP